MILRAVLDTNILVSGLLSPRGNPAQVLNALRLRQFYLFYSNAVIDEYQEVLVRSKFGFPSADVDDLVESILSLGYPVIPVVSVVYLPDEDDRAFYDTALSSASYLVTGNLKHYPDENWIISPVAFIRLLDQSVT
ncbi:MAG: putative toxin-antitoxin system toxin component, PIN family [Clostridiales bacterium]|jgi:putative PIN family toxin of toxin-antitoxin system|nr:putative toxin-antitoxin system toxin component, PIN family [Clostridiales bacterium]